MKFDNPVAQELFELMSCFESNISSKNRLVGNEEGVLLLMVKDKEVHMMGDARLNEQQIIAMTNYLSAFQVKLTQYCTELMKRG